MTASTIPALETIELTQKEILQYAYSGAVDVWQDFWTLTHDYRDHLTPKALEDAKEQLEIISKKCDWIKAQIEEIENIERKERREYRRKQKDKKVAA